MKRMIMSSLLGLGLMLPVPSCLSAQNNYPPPAPAPASSSDATHVSVGLFGDYLRYQPKGSAIGLLGVGARLGVNMAHNTAIEGEMDYDFAKNYTTSSTSSNGGTVTTNFTTVSIRPLWALFGPRFDLGSEHANFFLTGKVGIVNWTATNPNRVSSTTFNSAVSSIGGSGTELALYPGGGIQGYWGFFGLRAEVGDAIYVSNGVHNNLRATFGPQIRF
ncbi:MAG TPA: hypothetical protein VJS11_03545 [Acidobacteriaceae bacterium]|nr:hypothetical protein [Acidobacteriaceae bacterium]